MSAYTLVPKSDLPQLLSWAKQFWPETIKVCGELQSCLSDDWGGMEFVVDRWPNPTALVLRAETMSSCSSAEKFECRDFLDMLVPGVFGVNSKALAELLNTPGVISWTKPLMFFSVPCPLWPVVEKAAEDAGGKVTENKVWIMKATPDDIRPLPVPEGMKLVPATEDMVDIIMSTWEFTREHTDSFIRALIRRFPSLVMVTESNQHVGHMLGREYGAMGMLYVMPEFRSHGYAKVIITNLAQKHFDMGKDAYVSIQFSNPLSRKLHEAVGFKALPDFYVSFSYYTPGIHGEKAGEESATCES